MDQERGRSTSPYSGGKRKTDRRDDYEPPRKSPAGTPIPSPYGTPIPSPGHSPMGSPAHSPCRTPIGGSPSPLIYNCDDVSPSNSRPGSFKRRIKRNVMRRQSTGDVSWTSFDKGTSPVGDDVNDLDDDDGTPSFASLARQHRHNTSHSQEEDNGDTFGDMPNFHGNATKPSFQNYRPGSKDLLDDYLARKRDARRRSSCKEITFQLLRQDTAEMSDPDEPRFRLLERQRRLTIANKLMESISDSCENITMPPSGLFGTLTADNIPGLDDSADAEEYDLSKSPSLRLRSRSAEGYDPSQVKDTRQETRAMLFDSVPDLKDEEERQKFQVVRRSKRRGAVCYDVDNALSLLENLSISDFPNISPALLGDADIEDTEPE